MMLFHDAVALAVPGVATSVKACGPPEVAPVIEQLGADSEVELWVCRPCAEVRGYGDDRLATGFKMATIGDFHAAIRARPGETVVAGF
jgi:sulfur relay (sulfurtransferase) complex TusBCD TusD component (DsrE family)